MHPQRVQTKSPFTCAIKFSAHTLCVSCALMLLLVFQFLVLSCSKTVCLNAAHKTALSVKVNEHNSGRFNSSKFIIKYVKLKETAFEHLKLPTNSRIIKYSTKIVLASFHSSTVLHLCISDVIFPLFIVIET